jgi:lysophospholipase L1-like esterase
MDESLKKGRPHIKTYSVIYPRGTTAIGARYTSMLSSIRAFDPDVIYLHAGHNDLVFHPTHNENPINSEEIRSLNIDLAILIQHNHPRAKIIISSLYPRTFTDSSILTEKEVGAFNRLAKRHGQRLRKEAGKKAPTILVAMNMPLWKHISISQEQSSHYMPDGLHIKKDGKLALANAWYKMISTTTTPQPSQESQAPGLCQILI